MIKYFLIISLALGAILGSGSIFAQEVVKSETIELIDGKRYYIHSVEQGQTLYSISKTYKVPIDELKYENPDAGQGLAIGQNLRIPVTSREKIISDDLRDKDFRFIFHIVRAGETMYGISRMYDVPLDELKKANPEWADGLKTGQYVKIPMKAPEPVKEIDRNMPDEQHGQLHEVVRGETLYSISKKYKVSITALKQLIRRWGIASAWDRLFSFLQLI